MLGLYPVDSVEAAALSGRDGAPLALRTRCALGAGGNAASLHIGQLFAACVPGLATRLCDCYTRVAAPLGLIKDRTAGATPGSPRIEQLGEEGGAHASELPAAWLAEGGIALGCSVMSLQVAALSAGGPRPAAVLLAVQRASGHLGPLRTSARPGSLAAEMLAQFAAPPQGRGLRAAVIGMQLGVATAWRHARSRRGDLALAGAGVRAVTEPIEVQALMAAAEGAAADASSEQQRERRPLAPAGPPSTSYSGAGADSIAQTGTAINPAFDEARHAAADGAAQTCVAAIAVSPLRLRASGAELAALASAATGVLAEASRGVRGPFPQPGFPASMQADLESGWLLWVDVSTSSMHLLWSPDGAGRFAAALPQGADPLCHTLLQCALVSAAAVAASEPDPSSQQQLGRAAPALMLTLAHPSLSLREGASGAVPCADVSVALVQHADLLSFLNGVSVCRLGPPVAMLFELSAEQRPPVASEENGSLSGSSSSSSSALQLRLSAQDVSFGLALEQLAVLVRFNTCVLHTGPVFFVDRCTS